MGRCWNAPIMENLNLKPHLLTLLILTVVTVSQLLMVLLVAAIICLFGGQYPQAVWVHISVTCALISLHTNWKSYS